MECEIYSITSPSNKVYIGQTLKIRANGSGCGTTKRWTEHVQEANRNNGKGCTMLNKAIRKYQSENMIISILEECSAQEADNREKHYIEKFNSQAPNGYNLTSGGKNSTTYSEETRNKKENF